ncbi:hypothetical protein [Photobacterium sp. J15]|uniref:hypothetical protein n=1 Tax=Photobacterium sp. J15 TaxID=265901 RepID=UPI0012ED1BAB|nr:hypothetical protein [Photobacterium sp. J15]
MEITKLSLSIYTVAAVVIYGEVANPSLFEAIDLNLGVVTINQVDGLDITTVLLHLMLLLSSALCLINLKLFFSNLKQGFNKHPLLISEINSKLQNKTGSVRDRVSEANVRGMINPTASTGAWTSIGVGHGDISVKISRTKLLLCFITTPLSTLWLLKSDLLFPLVAALSAWLVSI